MWALVQEGYASSVAGRRLNKASDSLRQKEAVCKWTATSVSKCISRSNHPSLFGATDGTQACKILDLSHPITGKQTWELHHEIHCPFLSKNWRKWNILDTSRCRILETKNKRCIKTFLSPIKVSKKILCSKYSYIQFFIFTVIYSLIAERWQHRITLHSASNTGCGLYIVPVGIVFTFHAMKQKVHQKLWLTTQARITTTRKSNSSLTEPWSILPSHQQLT